MSVREVFELDFSKLSMRSAIVGTVALAVVIVFLAIFGSVAMAAGLAAVFVVMAGPSDTRRPDVNSLLFVLGGAGITFIVAWSSSSVVAATIVLSVITLGASLLALVGKRSTTMGVFLLLWSVLALGIGSTLAAAIDLAIAFALGGGFALLVMWLASLLPDRSATPENPNVADEPATTAEQPDQVAPAAPPSASVIRFAIVRALAVGLSVFLGYELFPDHATWVALTFVLVVRPPAHQTVVGGTARAIGTGLGVVLGVVIAQIDGDSLAIQVTAFVVCAFLMMATNKVNPVVSTLFTTTLLLISQEILQEQVAVAGWERLLATLLGVVFAFVAIAILIIIGRQKKASQSSNQIANT
jgi:hypothetical protein